MYWNWEGNPRSRRSSVLHLPLFYLSGENFDESSLVEIHGASSGTRGAAAAAVGARRRGGDRAGAGATAAGGAADWGRRQ